ncbi:MAG: hypothetical protein KJ915_00455 [Candidatus Omnitrophica bacterium]|nr:hypothetical protein [Candidatus Omnitrophota bacterium]
MRPLKTITICLLIQIVLLAPVQAFNFADDFCRENMSPSIYIQDAGLQDAFVAILKNDEVIAALQSNGWSSKENDSSGTYDSQIAGQTSSEHISEKESEYHLVMRSLVKYKFNLGKVEKYLRMGRKKINKIIGREVIAQGREEQRAKELKLEKEMLVCALQAYRWNVERASQETGIWKKRIYELIPSDVINVNRTIAEQELKELIIKVLEDNQWNVQSALKDERLVEQEVGKYILYSVFTDGWIDKQKQANIERIERSQKQEILAAINIFIHKKNCREEVEAYLGLARGTLGDRMRKSGININNIRLNATGVDPRRQELLTAVDKFIDSQDWMQQVAKELGIDEIQLIQRFREVKVNIYNVIYRPEIIIPVLWQTKGNVRSAMDILGLSHEPISRRFKVEIAYIRQQAAEERKLVKELRSVVIPMLEQTNVNVKLTAERLYLSESLIRDKLEADINRIYQENVSVQIILGHSNSLSEAGQAEMLINNAI